MALTVAQLQAALRIDSPDAAQTALLTRFLAVAVALVQEHAPGAPEGIRDEAAARVVGYLYDAPTTGRRISPLQGSGAASLLLPWRVHRAGTIDDAVAAAVAGSGSPVTGVEIDGQTLTVTFQDGTERTETLPIPSLDAYLTADEVRDLLSVFGTVTAIAPVSLTDASLSRTRRTVRPKERQTLPAGTYLLDLMLQSNRTAGRISVDLEDAADNSVLLHFGRVNASPYQASRLLVLAAEKTVQVAYTLEGNQAATVTAATLRAVSLAGSVDVAGVDARIATWARAKSPTGTIPVGLIPAAIARVAGIQAAATAAATAAVQGYVIPAATATKRGGVKAVTNTIIDAGTSTAIFGWALSHVRRLVTTMVDGFALKTGTAKLPLAKLPDGVSRFAVSLSGDNLPWTDRTYAKRELATHNQASYLCIRKTAGLEKAVTEPGVGSAWRTYWQRVGFAEVGPRVEQLALESGQAHTLATNAAAAAKAAQDTADAAAAGVEAEDHRQDLTDGLTADLTAGPVATGWTAAQATQGGIVGLAGTPTLAKARSASGWAVKPTSGIAGKHGLVRVLKTTNPAQARVEFRSGAGHVYESPLTAWQHLGESADDKWSFYGNPHILGLDVASLALQLTSSSAHVGGSKFAGTLTGGILAKLVGLAALADAVVARLIPTGGGDGKFLGHASGSPAWVAPPGAPTLTQIGATASVFGTRHGFSWSAADAQKFLDAWNGGTYSRFWIEITWNSGEDRRHVEIPRRPANIADTKRYKWYFGQPDPVVAGAAGEWYFDITRNDTDGDSLLINALHNNTFPTGAKASIFGVSP